MPATVKIRFMKKTFLFIGIVIFTVSVQAQVAEKFFVFLNTNPDRAELPEAEVNEIHAAHRANMDSLAEAKRLLAAGPFHGGGGIQVVVATSAEDANELVLTDPAVETARFHTEIFPLSMEVGGICPVQEPYEMVEYQFIRYVPVKEAIEAEKPKKLEKYLKRHINYIKANFYKRKLIANGDFGPGMGGFVVAFKEQEDDFDDFIKYDPYIRSGLYTADTRILWIAQGTFCERKPE